MVSGVAKQQVPEGYQQTEVGVIPNNWLIVELGNIGKSIIGLTYSPNDVSPDGALVLRSSNVQNNKLAFENNVFVDMELPDRVIVREGDILVCVRNGSRQLIGKCALIDRKTEGSAFGAFMSIYRSQYSSFIFYQFQSYIIQRQINEIMGATINQITNKDMAGFKVPLPADVTEQTTIAKALSDVDALITSLKKLIAKKRAIKTAAMQQLLTGKKRLPPFCTGMCLSGDAMDGKEPICTGTNLSGDAMDGKEPIDQTHTGYKQTELGEIPEDWVVIDIGSITTKVGSGKTPKGGSTVYLSYGRPLVRSQNVGWGDLKLDDVAYISEEIHKTFLGSELCKGDILLNITGASIGRCTTASKELVGGNVNQHVCIIRVDSLKIDSRIIASLILSDEGQRQIDSFQAGGNREGLNFTQVKALRFSLPETKEEQTSIANILCDMDGNIKKLEQRLNKTQQLKQGMMQELLTGRTRLL